MGWNFEIFDLCFFPGILLLSFPFAPNSDNGQSALVPDRQNWIVIAVMSQFSTFEFLLSTQIKTKTNNLSWQGRGIEGKQDNEKVARITKKGPEHCPSL